MNKLLSRIAALTSLTIALLAMILFLKDQRADQQAPVASTEATQAEASRPSTPPSVVETPQPHIECHGHTHAEDAISSSEQPHTPAGSYSKLSKALAGTLRGVESKKIETSSFDQLRRKQVGERVELTVDGVLLNGEITAVQRKNQFHKLSIHLGDETGDMLVSFNPRAELEAQVFIHGESTAFTINSNAPEEDTATLTKRRFDQIYCAPKGARYNMQALGIQRINAPVYTPTVPAPEDGEIPILNSKPDSEYVIYLDLDGEFVDDPFWTIRNMNQPINAAPMPSATNVSWVTAVFRRITEDYVPFDINVTTDFTVFEAADVEKRVQCVFTTTNFEGPTTGGIAIGESFGDDHVCWVFVEDEYYASYAASHEVGHTLHLEHHGDDVGAYYGGHGEGETSWAPLMGNGSLEIPAPFQRPNVTQWSIGEYNNADNSEQDDLEIITTRNNGLTYREDDYGDLDLTSETLSITDDSVSHYGIISKTDDEDWFKFVTKGGSVEIDVDITNIMSTEGQTASGTYGSNLAVAATLYDVDGTVITQSAETETLNGTVTTVLPDGLALYYLTIEGAGRKDPGTDGFSDYGSLGEYRISGTVPPANITLFGGNDQDQLVGPLAQATPANGTAIGFVDSATSTLFTISNTGAAPISTLGISSDLAEFTIENFTPTTLSPGESQTFNVIFDTIALRLYNATITLDYNDGSAQTYPFLVSATRSTENGDDNYEPNDTFFTPYDLSATPNIYLQYLLGYGIQNDNDWFKIAIPRGSNQISAQCDLIESFGSIDFLLYDNSGRLLLSGESNETGIGLSYLSSNTDGGVYYLLVKSAEDGGAATANYYDLIWSYDTVAVVPPAPEDAYEENDDYNSARDISSEPSLSGYLGLGTQLDNDWYKFATPVGDNRLDIQCSFLNEAGNIDILLYDHRGYEIIASRGTTDVEQITVPISYPGQFYYVAVISGEATATGNTYDLEWETSDVDVIDDFYEENDTLASANYALEESDVRLSDNVILGPGLLYDDDWFEFRPADDTVVMLIHAEYPDATGAIEIEVYDAAENLLSTGVLTENGAFVNIEVRESVYYLKVSGDNVGDSYDLYYENLIEDKYEPNDSGATATDLTEYNDVPLSRIQGSGIQNNDDWYVYDVPEGSFSLTVEANFIHSEGDLDMVLTAPDGLTYISNGVDDSELITIEATQTEETIPAGQYFLRLYGFAGNHNSAYDLVFSVEEPPAMPPPAPEDNYEPNNTWASPSMVLSPASQRGVLLSDINGHGTQLNADWYQISVPSGETLVTIQCDFTNYAEGNIDVMLYNNSGSPVATADSSTDNETITYLASAGTYKILVLGANAGIIYDLSWTSVTPPPEDNYEPNSFGSPTNINSQKGSWLSLLDGLGVQYNQDWYTFSTSGKNDIEIDCQFTHSEHDDLSIVLYRNGYNVASSDETSDNETLVYTDNIGGNATYKVLIDGPDNGTNYDLYWDATSIETTPPTEDSYENNDDYFEAYNLSNIQGQWLSSIDGYGVKIENDRDWYRIDVPANTWFVDFDSLFVNSDYEVYLYDKSGRLLYSWFGGSIGSAFPNPEGDTFYLQIVSEFNGSEYDLRWESIGLSIDGDSDQLPDAWEEKFGLSLSEVNTDDNIDSDRYPNWAEYTLNLDPNVFSSNVVRQFQDENYTYIQFIQRIDAVELGYRVTVKESPTLAFSTDEAVHVSTVPSPDDAETEIVTYRCSESILDAPKCFFMLEVSKPD